MFVCEYVWCVVCVCVHMYVDTPVCSRMWRPWDDVSNKHRWFFYLVHLGRAFQVQGSHKRLVLLASSLSLGTPGPHRWATMYT